MKREEMLVLLRSLHREELQVSRTKGKDYAGDDQVLSNFLDEAAHAGIDPIQVWYVFFSKHLRSIQSYVREGRLQSESLRSRVLDMRHYLALFLALASEIEGGKINIWRKEDYLEEED